MARKIWAFLAFNIYAVLILWSFQKTAAYVLDAEILSGGERIAEQLAATDWSWRDHYIWRLLAAIVATGLPAFLCGAISRASAGKTAIAANVPGVLLWMVLLYLLATGSTEIVGQTGFLVVGIIAIPASCFTAYYAAEAGSEFQKRFAEDTVLGIRPWHWIWAAIPLYLYMFGIVFATSMFAKVQLLSIVKEMSIVGSIVAVVALVPICFWITPLKLCYDNLAGKNLKTKSAGVVALINTSILVIGYFLALVVQMLATWLLLVIAPAWR